jgi:hypothetical protein
METSSGDNLSQQEKTARDILFGYIWQKEHEQWKSTEWAPEEEYEGPDY